MNKQVMDATNAELLELFANRATNDQVFIDWIQDNAIPHVRTRLDGVVERCSVKFSEHPGHQPVGQSVSSLYVAADANASIEKIVLNIQAFYLAGRIGVTTVKVVRCGADASASGQEPIDLLVIPARAQDAPAVFWVETQAMLAGHSDAQTPVSPQVFAITDPDMVVLAKKAHNISDRNGFFALHQPVFKKSKFNPNGAYTHAMRLTESWADYLEFVQDDGTVDVYQNAVRQLFDEQGKPMGCVSVSRRVNGQADHGKLLAKMGPIGYNRRIVDQDELKDSIGNSIEKSLAASVGFSLILLEISFDPVRTEADEQAQALFLKNLLNRFQKIIRRDDVISGISLNKFVVVLKNVTAPEVVGRISGYFKNVFAESHAFLEKHPGTRLNGGCASYPKDGKGFTDLMEKADIALGMSKLQVGNEIYHWNNVSEHVVDHQLAHDFTDAFERGDLHLVFQPQIDFYGLNLVRGVEVFPAWDHPTFGKIPPEKIIELADSHDLSRQLGGWMLQQTFSSVGFLQAEFGDGLNLSIGMLSPQMLEKNFVSSLTQAAGAAHVQPQHICLEIPAAMAMAEDSQATAILSELKAGGFRLSMDNFGINNFNLLHLRKTPLDVLKIDQSLVEDVSASEKNLSIIRCIINMAHALGLDVISGGAENFDQIHTLYRNGCYVFQGALTGKPMALSELVNWKAGMADITALRERIYSAPQSH